MGYIARRFDLERDAEALAKLWRENMSDASISSVVEQRMNWLYRENPLGPAATWLVADDVTSEVVGCASLYPRDVWVKGRRMRAGIGIDLAAKKEHRVAGPAVMLQRAITKQHQEAGFEFAYTYPNKGSLPVLKRVGFNVVAEASHWVKPVRTGYKLSEYVPIPAVVRAAALFLDRGLGLADRRHILAGRGLYEGSLVDAADGRFDELWERARGAYSIVGDKSAAYLNWRYTTCKTANYRYFCLTERATGRLAGFAIFTVRDNKAFVADAFCQDQDVALSHLFVKLASRARHSKVDSLFVAYAGAESFTRRLHELNFVRREFSRALVVSAAKDMPEELRASLLDKESWFLFDGELDL